MSTSAAKCALTPPATDKPVEKGLPCKESEVPEGQKSGWKNAAEVSIGGD